LIETYIYAGIAFITGFIAAWIFRTITISKLNKLQRSTEGYLESEKLMKETIQKENVLAHQMKQSVEFEYAKKLQEAQRLNKILDENILLLQKSNEETEALMKAGLPALHELKLKLIEANNTIARYKAQIEMNK
jgi:hypothetical protein